MKIAIPCPGVGHIRQGFETFALDLAAALEADARVVVYGGRRAPEARVRVRALPTIVRRGRVARMVVPTSQRYRLEQLVFAAFLLNQLRVQPCDVVHVSDSLVGLMVMRMRRALGINARVIFSNGGNREPDLLGRFDLCQVLTPIQYQNALDSGVPAEQLAMVPYGVDCNSFAPSPISRTRARTRLALPEDMKVVLSVAPLGYAKRLDYLIREIAMMKRKDVVLLIAGQPTAETEALTAEAAARLPGRFRFVTLPHNEMPWAFQAADIFTLTSLREGFGISVLEGLAAGVPTVVHDWPLFQWLVPNPLSRIDMRREGALADRFTHLLSDPETSQRLAWENRCDVAARFDWSVLKNSYLDMYRHVTTGDLPR